MNQIENRELRIAIFCIVIAIILVNSIVYINVFEFNIILVLINLMMIVTNVIALLLFKSHKIISYLAGLFSFLFSLFFQFIITEKILIWSDKFAVGLTICFIYFIFDEINYKRKHLNK